MKQESKYLLPIEDMELLRKNHCISLIAKQIPSKRSRSGHMSREHVKNILTGKDSTSSLDNDRIYFAAVSMVETIKRLDSQNLYNGFSQDIEKAKEWLCEMMDIIPEFTPAMSFENYTDPSGMPRFDREGCTILNKKLTDVSKLFSYHMAAPGDDIYTFCLEYQSKQHVNS